MKRKKLYAIILAFAVTLTTISTANVTTAAAKDKGVSTASLESERSNYILENNYIRLNFTSYGDYRLVTNEGNPHSPLDNNAKLLFGNTNTEYILMPDGTIENVFTSSYGDVVINGNSAVSTTVVGDFTIKRTMTLGNSTNSNYANAIKYNYEITNNGSTAQTISFRSLIDTMLGDNDHAPFRMPNENGVTKMTRFEGNNVPSFWFAYDSLENPTIVSRGEFLPGSMPDKVDFCNWSRYDDITDWNYTLPADSSIGDSAVAMFWNNKTIPAGETISIKTNYGVDEITGISNADMSAALNGGNTITINPTENNTYNPYSAVLNYSNTGTKALTGVTAKIVIPDEFNQYISIADQDAEVAVGNLAIDAEGSNTWNLNIDSSASGKNLYYQVIVDSNESEPITITQNLNVAALYEINIGCTLDGGNKVELSPNEDGKYADYTSKLNITNNNVLNLNDISATITIPDEFKDLVEVVGDKTILLDSLLGNASTNTSWNLKFDDSLMGKEFTYSVVVKTSDNNTKVVNQTIKLVDPTVVEPEPNPDPEVKPETKPEVKPEAKPESKPGNKLPQTGDVAGAALPLMGIISSAAGIFLYRKGKRD